MDQWNIQVGKNDVSRGYMNERYFVSFHAVSDKTVASQDIARRQQDIPRAFLLLQPYPTCAKSDSIELDSNESTLEFHQNQAETCTKNGRMTGY
jgi:hypothetical protein